MQKLYSQNGGAVTTPAPLSNTGIHSLDPRAQLALRLHQARVQRLIDQMRLERRFWQAMEARRRLVSKPPQPPVESGLYRALDEAAAWLAQHPGHPDASAVLGHLDRIAPGWRRGGNGGQGRSAQGGR
jgi:hypothetical protein